MATLTNGRRTFPLLFLLLLSLSPSLQLVRAASLRKAGEEAFFDVEALVGGLFPSHDGVITILDGDDVSYAAGPDWSNCDKDAALTLMSLDIDPYPLQHGATSSCTASGTLSRTYKGSVDVSVSLEISVFGRFVKFPCIKNTVGSCTFQDICTNNPFPGFSCPTKVETGKITVGNDITIPDELKKGTFRGQITAKDDEGPFACVSFTFKIE